MHFQVQDIHSLVADFRPNVVELLPALEATRRSTVRVTDLDRVDDFAERSVVQAEYADRPVRWPPVLHVVLDDAYVFGLGTVIWRNRIVKETLPMGPPAEADHQFPEGRKQEDGRWLVDVGETIDYASAFLATRYRIKTYGHWIGELLPRIDLASQAGMLEGRTLLFPARCTPDAPGGYARMMRDSLRAIGASRNACASIPSGGLRVERLEVVTPMGTVRTKRPEIHQTFRRIAAQFQPTETGPARLYLTRDGVGSRGIANEQEVQHLLAERGFVAVQPELMSLGDQVRLFSSAEAICGPLGSAFVNMVFAPPECVVLALIPEQWRDTFFYDLAATRRMPWYEVRGPVADDAKAYHRNNFVVDIERLATVLDHAVEPGARKRRL